MINKLIIKDDSTIPYVGFLISPKDFELIQHMKINWYDINGQKLFKVKDKEGNDTGEFIAYLTFDRE